MTPATLQQARENVAARYNLATDDFAGLTMPGIYQIVNTANGKRYIGSAVNFRRRWGAHKSRLRRGIHKNPHMQSSWNKHGGERFIVEIIERVTDVEKLIEREQYHVDRAKPEFNMCPVAGSRLGSKISPEQSEKLSKRAKAMWADPVWRAEHYQRLIEQIKTPEARQKRREKLRGIRRTADVVERVTAAQNRPEVRAKRSSSLRAYYALPGAKDFLMGAQSATSDKRVISIYNSDGQIETGIPSELRARLGIPSAGLSLMLRGKSRSVSGWAIVPDDGVLVFPLDGRMALADLVLEHEDGRVVSGGRGDVQAITGITKGQMHNLIGGRQRRANGWRYVSGANSRRRDAGSLVRDEIAKVEGRK